MEGDQNSVFDLADSPPVSSGSLPSGTQSPSWAMSGEGPSWAKSELSVSSDGTLLPDLMKRSQDQLRSRRKSWTDLVEDAGGWDVGEAVEDIGPDQIGGFVRIADDQMRVHRMHMVLTRLRQKLDENDSSFLSRCVLTVLRLSLESAFPSVRTAFAEVAQDIRQAALPGVSMPSDSVVVTRWVRPNFLPSVQTNDDEEENLTQRLLRSIDIMEGRIPHVIMVLAWHPTFMEKWYRTMMHLMRGSGPLPFTWRRYISIVACARFQCMPMIKLQELDFLTSGGDPEWLAMGIEAPSLPPKLYALLELNGLLAHQPWRIDESVMEKLLSSSSTCWSVGELVHAIAIMVTFHSICGVVWGLGVTPEVDISETFATTLDTLEPQAAEEGNTDTSHIVDMLRTGGESFMKQRQNWAQSGEDTKSSIWAKTEEPSNNVTAVLKKQAAGGASAEYCQRYVGSFELEYNDFDIANNAIFYKAQYNWQEDGYSMVHQVLDGLAPLLGAEFQHIRALTYNKFAHTTELDTSAFRDAVAHYAHRIKGLLDDDYNYSEVNQLLTRQMKFYVKKVTCFPQTVTMTDFVNLSYDLLPSEKCHIALLATEASKEASLSYALKALSIYLKK